MVEKKTLYLTEQEEDLKQAADLLKQGKTVIFPTETVYGLGANGLDPVAVQQIFSAKGRPSDNPLILHIAKREELLPLVKEIPQKAEILMDAFWPGPLTLIFPKSELVPLGVTGGLNTVAVRMPSQKVAHRLLQFAGIPVAAPSANLSGKPSPTEIDHVREDMDGRVDAIIDGGDCMVGVESTVLDVSVDPPILYRPGGVTVEQIEATIGKISVVAELKKGEAPRSPGLKYKHYAPKAEVQVLHGSWDEVKSYIQKQKKEKEVGVLVFDEFPHLSDVVTISLGSKSNPEEAAHRLFTALRRFDEKGVDLVLAPELSQEGIWRAVRNRLYRAAGENIIDLSKEKQTKVLLVCTGNTCRSPMAEGLMKKLAKEKKVAMEVSSAGFCADDFPASDLAIEVMEEVGISIKEHRSQHLSIELIEEADLILTMTHSHKESLLSAVPSGKDKTMTLAEWAGETEDVSDPYGGTITDYQSCRDQIKTLLEKGWEKIYDTN